MKWRNIICLFVTAALVLTLSVGSATSAQRPLKVALCIVSMEFPFFVTMVEGAKDAGKVFNVEVTDYDGQNRPELQMRQVEDAIAMGYDGILLNPITAEGLVPAVKKANAAGIPVFTLDRDVVGGKRICYIGTSNVSAAEDGVRTLIKALSAAKRPKPWRIVHLWGTPGASSAMERSKGIHNILDPLVKKGEIEIVADLTAEFNKPTGMRVMEDILATTSDIDAVITGNDDMALGALEALKGTGLKIGFPDGLIIVGFDAIDPAVEAVARNEMYATVAQSPYVMGYWGVEAMTKYIREGWTPPPGTPVYEPTKGIHLKTSTVIILPFKQLVESLTKSPPLLPTK